MKIISLLFILLLIVSAGELGFYFGMNYGNSLLNKYSISSSSLSIPINTFSDPQSLSLPTLPSGTIFDPSSFKNDFNTSVASNAAKKGMLVLPKVTYIYRGILSQFKKGTELIDSKGNKKSDIYSIVLNNPLSGKKTTVSVGVMSGINSINVKLYLSKENNFYPAMIDDLKIGDFIQYKVDINLINSNVINKEIIIIK